MTADRFARVETLYHAARARAPEERPAYLAGACGEDAALRREVESLLAQHGALTSVAVIAGPALASGTVIGTYRIVEQIGAGGMGEVYRAHDNKLGRDVALKVLPQAVASDRDRLARLEREARLLASLNHANIAHVYGLEESNGTRAIAMELIEGETLADRIARGPIPVDETLPIARQIASALAAAHDHGIIHRDLKPANVKVQPDGTVKVLDFGLAKAMDTVGASRTTEDGAILGTAAYMSPEQASGKPVDRRTDLWAFGVVLMEMLTGRRVFDGESTAHVLSSVLKLEPDWSELPDDTPPVIRRLLRRCLAKDPVQRLDSAAAARLDLDDNSNEATVPQPSAGAIKPWMRLALVGVAAALLSAGVYLRWRQGAGSFTETPLTAYPGYQGQPTLSSDGNQFAFVWYREAEQGPAQLYVRPLTGGTPLQLTSTPGTFVSRPAWSSDGQMIAFIRGTAGTTSASGDLTVIPALGGPARVICKALFSSRITWSPDSTLIYFAAPLQQTRAIFVINQRSGASSRVTDPPAGALGDRDPAISADGRQLVFVRSLADFNNELLVADLANGASAGAPRVLTRDSRSFYSPVWSPDATSVLYTAGDNAIKGIYRIPASGGTPSRLALSGGDYAVDLALSRSGDRLVYSRAVFDLNMYRVPLSSAGTILGQPAQFGSSTRDEESPTFSPDGRHLAFASNRAGSNQIYVADADGSNPVSVTSFTRGVAGSPKWSPNSERIVFDARPDGLSDVYSIKADGGDLRRLTDNPAEDHLPCYSADGTWIYFRSTRSGPGELYRMPAAGGDAVKMTRNGALSCIASPDRRWIYFSKLDGGIWKIPADGGGEILVISPERFPSGWAFTVSQVGIYYAGPFDVRSRTALLRLQRFDDGKTVDLMTFDKGLRLTFSVSADEKWFAWAQLDKYVTDLILITNFR